MAKKKRVVFKKEFFHKKLLEYNCLIIFVALVVYPSVFGYVNSKYGDCGLFETCDWGLDKFIFGIIIANIIVFLVELFCFGTLIKKSPKKIDVTLLSFVFATIVIPIFMICMISGQEIGLLFFLLYGSYNIVLFIMANLFLLLSNKK